MSTDRELLELAAKAAGLQWDAPKAQWWDGSRGAWFDWSPLERDEEALRLAVKLHIPISFPFKDDIQQTPGSSVVTWDARESHEVFFREHDGDANAATRRAVVLAAAAMAKEPQ